MDPTLTTAGAHKLFGELYRKTRPPEAQAKVDQVVSETQDVFARIRRIEEIDAGLAAGRKSGEAADDPRKRRPGGGGRKEGGAGVPGSGGGSGSGGAPATRTGTPPRKKKEKGPGFFASLFGNELTRWGKSTGTLESGLLALNYKLSDDVGQLFRQDEMMVISAIKGMRFALQRGWQNWEPARYNTAMTALQFFNEFIKVDAVLRTKESPEAWIAETLKLQRFYALLIQFPKYKEFLTGDLPKMVELSRTEHAAHAAALEKAGQFIAHLDDRKPSLKNSIAAFYSIARKKVVTWEDVLAELRVKKPVTDSYRAPEAVMLAIHNKMKSLRDQVRTRGDELKEIEDIRSRYLAIDSQGKLNTDFLNEIVADVVRRMYSENAANDSVMKSHKVEPHRLLLVALRDLDFSAVPIFAGSVQTLNESSHEEVILFKQGLFKKHVDTLTALARECEQLVKGNSQFHYNFPQFMEDRKKDKLDPPASTFAELVQKSMRLFRVFSRDLEMIMDNHALAKSHGSSDEKMNRTKVLPVETISLAARFLPHADREIAASGRFHGKTVEDTMNRLIKQFYNYLYIFRDEEFVKKIAGAQPIQDEIRAAKEQLARMGEK